MEPYYTAAFAYYKLEYLFRSGKLERKCKPARFHILLAVRLLGNPAQFPKFMNSREMEDYCKPLLTALWDSAKCDELIGRAAGVVEAAAGSNFNRDNIRTEPTTKKVIAQCQTVIAAEKTAIE
ncbi:MAG: hypothetical protein LAN64_10800 [Acidobacteriia bacterium]|nr:hypothetical protein [Terriglobia bacterium]